VRRMLILYKVKTLTMSECQKLYQKKRREGKKNVEAS